LLILLRKETSPLRTKSIGTNFKKKALKTARLFPAKPSKLNKKPSTARPQQQQLFEKKPTHKQPIRNIYIL